MTNRIRHLGRADVYLDSILILQEPAYALNPLRFSHKLLKKENEFGINPILAYSKAVWGTSKT